MDVGISTTWRHLMSGGGTGLGLSPKASAIFAACLFLPCFLILAWAAAPSVTFHDSGEFVLAATSAGISHPSGAPSWTLPAHLFLKLFRFADPAYGTNLLSAFLGAATLALLGVWAANWIGNAFSPAPCWVMLSGGVLSALTLLNSAAFIEQSTTTKNYTLNTALIVVLFMLGALFTRKQALSTHQAWTWSFFLGLVYGVAVGSHTCLVILGFPTLLFLGHTASRCKRKTAGLLLVAGSGIGLTAGLSVFAWIPLRAAAHPLMNYGHVESAAQFWRFVNRQQGWAHRPLHEAPAGFIRQWLASYDFAGQLGWFGLFLAVAGTVWLARRLPFLLLCLVAAIVPYACGMLFGHLQQASIGILYIQQYGASTFHLPLYLALSLAAGIGLAGITLFFLRRQPAVAYAAGLAVMLLSAGTAWSNIGNHSLRHYEAPAIFVKTVLAPIPKNAILLLHSDNLIHMLAYETYGPNQNNDLWVAYDLAPISGAIQRAVGSGQEWNAACRRRHVTQSVCNPATQPLTLPALTEKRLRESSVFAEYSPDHPLCARWLLPAGFLFEVKDGPTSDDEVRQAEARWRLEHPQAWRRPSPKADRMEREAWALLFTARGAFFVARGLLPEAEASYGCALEWYPADGNLWFCLADIKEKRNLNADAESAYRNAIRYAPELPGPRWNLALMLANHDAVTYQQAANNGTSPEARDQKRRQLRQEIRGLLLEELRLTPNNSDLVRALRELGA